MAVLRAEPRLARSFPCHGRGTARGSGFRARSDSTVGVAERRATSDGFAVERPSAPDMESRNLAQHDDLPMLDWQAVVQPPRRRPHPGPRHRRPRSPHVLACHDRRRRPIPAMDRRGSGRRVGRRPQAAAWLRGTSDRLSLFRGRIRQRPPRRSRDVTQVGLRIIECGNLGRDQVARQRSRQQCTRCCVESREGFRADERGGLDDAQHGPKPVAARRRRLDPSQIVLVVGDEVLQRPGADVPEQVVRNGLHEGDEAIADDLHRQVRTGQPYLDRPPVRIVIGARRS